MKGLVITSDKSGGGKTTVTLGLMKALIKRGYKVQGYKVGPDYIDTEFHSYICKQASRNLDIHLMGEEGVKASFTRGRGDIAIVEGVMGFYDGIGLSTQYSTSHIANLIDLPVVLVLSPKAQVATLFAQIKGILSYEKNNIVGIILNNIGESYYKILKKGIEENCNIKVLGYLPSDPKVKLESRQLGLIPSAEVNDLEIKIDYLSNQMEKYIDINSLIKIMRETPVYKDTFHMEKKNIKIGVALDQAFSFYYKENLELLEEMGEVEYFSPLKDSKLPENLDFLYISGGYTEVFYKELSKNQALLGNIKEQLEKGLVCYAECGGLVYLTQGIDENTLVGFFDGKFYTTNRLQNFGYATITVSKENHLLPKGLEINCQEFHRSYVELENKTIYSIAKQQYDGEKRYWDCGYLKNNTLGTYAHTHFFGNMDMLKSICAKIKELKS